MLISYTGTVVPEAVLKAYTKNIDLQHITL